MDNEATSPSIQAGEQNPPARGVGGQPTAIVGLGASAGGVQAIQHFFQNVPDESGMAFVVILHLSAEHESNLASVIQSCTAMPVVQVTEDVTVEPNHVYVIPPARYLEMVQDSIHLVEMDPVRTNRAPIDLFFRSLAESQESRAVAVVLSGTGSDGTIGLKRVKEREGITIAQEPAEAEYDNMPRSAINTGLIDLVLPVAQMPSEIARLLENYPRALPVETGEPLPGDDEEALQQIFSYLSLQTGHNFAPYKRPTVLRRLARRMQINYISDIPSYLRFLRQSPLEPQELLADLLISVTNFFRDAEAFDSLAETAIPDLFENRTTDEPVRVWVAGCATGEEAYSIAILLAEQAGTLNKPVDFQIFASDINDSALRVARAGLYPSSIAADLSNERLQRFFVEESDHYRIREEIRSRIVFASHNILEDPPFSRMDLICCRNLLIYVRREIQPQLFALFHFALQPSRFLFLGAAESADGAEHLFAPVDKRLRLYQRRDIPQGKLVLPAIPITRSTARSLMPPADTREKQNRSWADIHRGLISAFAPASVMVNEAFEILYLSDRAGEYLQFTGGEPSHSLLHLITPELQLELRAVLSRAQDDGGRVQGEWVRLLHGDHARMVSLIVQPVQLSPHLDRFFLVVFSELDIPADIGLIQSGGDIDLARQLEEELRRTHERLHLLVEQYETSIEETRASNEELQSTNEELQSTAEELETSREELQSVNEELTTVNQELRNKVDQLSSSNSDLQNLMAATDIGTIFLTRNLRVRWYTPRITDLFHIIATDLGRPVTHVTHELRNARLVEDVTAVLKELSPVTRVVESTDGRWYIMRIRPYRTAEDRIEGVVLAFIDITEQKQAEEEVRQSHDELEKRVEERTADLATLNEALEREIALRQRLEQARRQLLGQVVRVQEEERQHLARELHDDVVQDLMAIGYGLALHRKRVAANPDGHDQTPAQLEATFRSLEGEIAVIGRRVRDFISDLRPAGLDDLGLPAALQGYVAALKLQSDPDMPYLLLNMDDRAKELPYPLSITLFRIAQEGIRNAVRHARASRVEIDLTLSDTTVELRITDNGIGFDVSQSMTELTSQGHFGLLGISERAEIIGGEYTIESREGGGTMLVMRAPLPTEKTD